MESDSNKSRNRTKSESDRKPNRIGSESESELNRSRNPEISDPKSELESNRIDVRIFRLRLRSRVEPESESRTALSPPY
jgi:hypothetical protein